MAESYTGEVRDGVVVFDGTPPPLPTGTKVRIWPITTNSESAPRTDDAPDADPVAGTRQRLLAWARRAEEVAPPLRSDLAENHDHDAHGKPRE